MRRLLAVFIVTSTADVVDENDLIISLREAINSANGSVGSDLITFDSSVFAGSAEIDLALGQLNITDSLTIRGPQQHALTIDAQDGSRVLNIESSGADVTIAGLTITGGLTTGDNEESGGVTETTNNGGGIRFVGAGSLRLDGVTVTGNRTSGAAAMGGGIFADGATVKIVDSAISQNRTEGESARGGGLFVSNSADNSIIGSDVSNNSTSGDSAGGGGLSSWQADVWIDGSRFTGNQTSGSNSTGGAIESRDWALHITRSSLQSNSTAGATSSGGGLAASNAIVLISESAVVNNSSSGDSADGAGVFLDGSTAAMANATISGNSASGTGSSGGGLFSGQGGVVSIINSTITGNSATGDGGGINIGTAAESALEIANSIVAGNSDSGTAADLLPPTDPDDLSVRSSLIGDKTGTALTEAQTADADGNLIGDASSAGVIDPLLAPLAINGGSTPTHKPLAASPLLDAGDDTLALGLGGNPLTSDGRDAPFQRFFGTVDMGAFEAQSARQPIIEWSDPANIFVGTELSDLQLNATTNTLGTFTYSPDIGTILSVGDGQALIVQFTPDDTVHYGSTSASVSIDVVEQADLGDAPDSYATLRASDGPRHLVGSLRLGSLVDAEVDGQPSDEADDDGGDDGVSLISSLVADPSSPTIATFNVNTSSSGMLDAWIDFNGNGVFDHPSEHLGGGTSIKLASRDNIVPVSIPAGSTPGQTYARFRFSSAGGLLPTGSAADGEVEDHVFSILDGSASQIIDLDLPNGPARLFSDAGELVIQRRDVDLFRAPASAVDRFEIIGHEFSNVLTIDTTGGAAVPAGGLSFDGVDRVNTVRLVGPDNSLDLSRDGNVSLRNIDVIDISDPADSSLSLDAGAVRAMDPNGSGVIVVGSPLDEIVFVDGPDWRMADPVDVAGFTFSFVTLADTFVQLDFGSLWRNRAQPEDVNNDGNVTAGDALRIINELVRREFSDRDTTQLNDLSDTMPWPNHYYDVSGDRQATALDALRVINYLARKSNTPASGEGELAQASLDGMSARITLPTTVSTIDAFDVPTPFGSAQRRGEAAPKAAVDSVDRDGISERPEGAGDISESAQVGEGRSAPSPFAALDQLWTDPFFVDELRLRERF